MNYLVPETDEIVKSAIKWWMGRRPFGWDKRKHLKNPVINTSMETEKNLARSIAKYLIATRPGGRDEIM